MLTVGDSGLQRCILFFKCTHQAEREVLSAPRSSKSRNECIYVLFPLKFFKDVSGNILQKVCNLFSRTKVRILKNCEDVTRNCSVKRKHLILIEAVLKVKNIHSNSPKILFLASEDSLRLFQSSYYSIPLYVIKGDLDFVTVAFEFEEEHLKILENLLSGSSKFCYGHRNGGTILHFATLKNDIALMKVLLNFQYRSEINAPQSDGSSPLFLAVKKGYTNIVKILLEHGADVHNRALNFITECADLIPPGAGSGQREIIIIDDDNEPTFSAENFDLDSGVEDRLTPLHLAAKKGREDIVELLLLHGADVNAEVTVNYLGRTFTFSPLLIAAQSGHHKVVDTLLRFGADINAAYLIDNERRSVFHEALVRKNKILTEIILKHKPCVNNKFNQKALTFALLEYYDIRDKEFVDLICRYGFTLSMENVENCDETELVFAAVHKSQMSFVKYLLQRDVSLVNKLWKPPFLDSECTLIHMAAAFSDEEMIEFLLHHGAQVDSLDGGGQTPSFYAVITRNRRVLKYLIVNGANVSDYPELPFGAVFRGDHIILEMLLLHGARVNSSFRTPRNSPFLPIIKSDEIRLEKFFRCKGVRDLVDNSIDDLMSLLVCKGSLTVPSTERVFHPRRGPEGFADSMTHFVDVPLIFYAVARYSEEVFNTLFKYGAFSNLNSVKFDKKSLIVAAECYIYEFSGISSMFSQLLNCNFPHFDRSRCFENYLLVRINDYRIREHANSYVKYLMKINCCSRFEVLNENSVNLWTEEEYELEDYQSLCEEEIVRLKNEQVGDTGFTLYDILLEDETRIASYARNPGFASLLNLENSEFPEQFPIYSLIIVSKIEKSFCRKDLTAEGIRLYSFFFKEFSILPFDIKELIVNHIPTYDLQVLKTATLNRLKRCIC